MHHCSPPEERYKTEWSVQGRGAQGMAKKHQRKVWNEPEVEGLIAAMPPSCCSSFGGHILRCVPPPSPDALPPEQLELLTPVVNMHNRPKVGIDMLRCAWRRVRY
mmetsp:Transcript_48876/g.147264  ORF Transcript_48876/g.147264 Transcript_48876/m.147264 type:complete len:105 (-) Transcript_48876:1678-1992(-)